MRIGRFMRQHVDDGFGSLDEVSDAIQTYNPHRPRPTNLDGLRKNVRQRRRSLVLALGPVVHRSVAWAVRMRRVALAVAHRSSALEAAARSLTIPTLLVRGLQSDLLSEEGAQRFLELAPHAELADVAGAGHMVAGDRNDALNGAVVTFLERLRD